MEALAVVVFLASQQRYCCVVGWVFPESVADTTGEVEELVVAVVRDPYYVSIVAAAAAAACRLHHRQVLLLLMMLLSRRTRSRTIHSLLASFLLFSIQKLFALLKILCPTPRGGRRRLCFATEKGQRGRLLLFV